MNHLKKFVLIFFYQISIKNLFCCYSCAFCLMRLSVIKGVWLLSWDPDKTCILVQEPLQNPNTKIKKQTNEQTIKQTKGEHTYLDKNI